MNNEKSSANVLLSVILFVVGAILFAKSEEVFNTITLVLGIVFIIYAIIKCLIFANEHKKGINDPVRLLSAAIIMVLAIVFLFFNDVIYYAINFITGGWILFIGINRLAKAISHKRKPLLVTSLLIILLSIYILLNGTDIYLRTLGIVIMVYSALDIINFILYAKEDREEEKVKKQKDGSELIIHKKENKLLKKKNNIKDVEAEEK